MVSAHARVYTNTYTRARARTDPYIDVLGACNVHPGAAPDTTLPFASDMWPLMRPWQYHSIATITLVALVNNIRLGTSPAWRAVSGHCATDRCPYSLSPTFMLQSDVHGV